MQHSFVKICRFIYFFKCRVFIDRMHFKNHVDSWCRKHMNPNDIPEVKNVNTEVKWYHFEYCDLKLFMSLWSPMQACEQLFSWLSGYKSIVRHMNEARFIIFICRMCHLHNCSVEKEMARKGLLVRSGASADITIPLPFEQPSVKPSPLFQDAVRMV